MIIPLKEGIISDGSLVEIGEIIAGLKLERVGRGITVFKSVGLFVQDLVAASLVIICP